MSIIIEMTDEQLRKLEGEFKRADAAYLNGEKGVVCGQAWDRGVFEFGFIPNHIAAQVIEIIEGYYKTVRK